MRYSCRRSMVVVYKYLNFNCNKCNVHSLLSGSSNRCFAHFDNGLRPTRMFIFITKLASSSPSKNVNICSWISNYLDCLKVETTWSLKITTTISRSWNMYWESWWDIIVLGWRRRRIACCPIWSHLRICKVDYSWRFTRNYKTGMGINDMWASWWHPLCKALAIRQP